MPQAALAALVLFTAATTFAADAPPPNEALGSILFWTPTQQETGYRSIENIFPTRVIKAGTSAYPLPVAGDAFDVSYGFRGVQWTTDSFMKANRVSGLLIIKDGRIVLERYGLGRTAADRWTSFSVGKSVTATLIGAAIQDGSIKSLEAGVTDYLPGLKGSTYEGVTIRHLLTMTSGVKWNEDYADPNSDVALFAAGAPGPDGENPIVAYMAKLPREAAPGTKFVYKTGESDLIGVLLERATGKRPAEYLSEKIWSKFGMEQDGLWMLDRAGVELGGCCISMTLRDYGRFGLFILNGGVAGGEQVVPADFLAQATRSQVKSHIPIYDYGFQWWIHPDGAYEASGIFGQSIYVVPAEKLVIVTNSAWAQAEMMEMYANKDVYVEAVRRALGGR
ncbi:MAG: serine hydrolase domain-containing protein [Steroidobacteraceae bacterium]